ncbi:MAG: GNAT family N-acetyltransferase [Clostridia bacterium]|nr:GNAT family N-acetyltransferase [Clostridia bacterium]
MEISIRPTVAEEADELAKIQKAAFLPLYEKYHDVKSPYLRGVEDILKRLDSKHRCFTILCDGKIVGGIYYHLLPQGSKIALEAGEYYLGRLFIHPEHQCKGIGSTAIRLCETEFPEARGFYVDFPVDMEKNRRCYEKAGFRDTGKVITEEGAPDLAVYKKTIKQGE